MYLAYRNKLPDVGVGNAENVSVSFRDNRMAMYSDLSPPRDINRLRLLVARQENGLIKDDEPVSPGEQVVKLPVINVKKREKMPEQKCDYRLSAFRENVVNFPELKAPPTVGKYRHRAKVIPVCSISSPDACDTQSNLPPNTNNQLLRDAFIKQRKQTSPGFDEADVLKICEQYSILRYLNSADDQGARPKSRQTPGSRSRGLQSRISHYTMGLDAKPYNQLHKDEAKMPRDSLMWIPRLGAWISQNTRQRIEYFHFGKSTTVTTKYLPVCCRHHDFFHNNLHWEVRNWIPSLCPRYFLHHKKRGREDNTERSLLPAEKLKRRKRKPLTIPKDPFKSKTNRDIKRPWLRPPQKLHQKQPDPIQERGASVTLVLPNEKDRKYQWMIDNATMTDETVSVVSSPSVAVVQSRTSTPHTKSSMETAILVPHKIVTTVDRGCDPIDFSPLPSRRESVYTAESGYTEGSDALNQDLQDASDCVEQSKMLEEIQSDTQSDVITENQPSDYSNADVTRPGERNDESDEQSNQIDENQLTHDSFGVGDANEHDAVVVEGGKVSTDRSDDEASTAGESSGDSYVAVIVSESESSLRSRASSPVLFPRKMRAKPPPPKRRARPPVAVPITKVEDGGSESDSSTATGSTTRKTSIVPPPTYKGRQGSGKSVKSLRSLIEVHSSSPTPSEGSRRSRGKAVRDQAVLDDLRRMQQAEERRKRVSERFDKMKMLRNVPPPPNPGNTPTTPLDDDFLSKYCILNLEKLDLYRRSFNKVDRDKDGYLSCQESVKAIRKMFPNKKAIDEDIHYVFRILEMANYNVFAGSIDFHLFSIIVSLMQRIATLDDFTRNLIAEMDLSKADVVMWKAKNLFESHVDDKGNNTISLDNLWIELHAGGISPQHELQVRKAWQHLTCMDVLDFLTYLPLFTLTHSTIVSNPLSTERSI